MEDLLFSSCGALDGRTQFEGGSIKYTPEKNTTSYEGNCSSKENARR
jgi:hypothetical protein